MRVALTHFGVDFYNELVLIPDSSWKYALIKKMDEEDLRFSKLGYKPLDMNFWKKLIKRYGAWQPYHPEFSSEFPLIIANKPLPEIEPFLTAMTEAHVLEGGVELDEEFFRYISDVLQEAISTSTGTFKTRITRALEWYTQQQQSILKQLEKKDAVDSPAVSTKPASLLLSTDNASDPPASAIDSSEQVLANGFSFKEADEIATEIGLIVNGTYSLGDKKFAAVVGFYSALKHGGKLSGTVEKLTEVFGKLYKVVHKETNEIMTTTKWRNTKCGEMYYNKTKKELSSRYGISLYIALFID
jgi:hypothetical protein